MKNIILIIMLGLVSLCASAQGAQPPILDKAIEQISNNIKFLQEKLPEIKTEEQNTILQNDPNIQIVPNERLTPINDELLDKSEQILSLVQQLLKKDSTNTSEPQKALEKVSDVLSSFVSVAFSDSTAKKIQINKNFEQVLQKSVGELDETLNSLQTLIEDQGANQENDEVVSNDKENEETNGLNIVNIIEIVCIVILLCLITFYFKHYCSKLNKKIRDLEFNYKSVENKFSAIRQENSRKTNYTSTQPHILSEEEIRRFVQEELKVHLSPKEKEAVAPIPNHPSVSEKKQNNCNGHQQAAGAILYGQLQNDGSFKVSPSARTAFYYIIKLQSSNSLNGEFTLKEMDCETMKAVIENRQTHLVPGCDISSASSTPSKILVEKPGTVEKQGNYWVIQRKAQITLVNG